MKKRILILLVGVLPAHGAAFRERIAAGLAKAGTAISVYGFAFEQLGKLASYVGGDQKERNSFSRMPAPPPQVMARCRAELTLCGQEFAATPIKIGLDLPVHGAAAGLDTILISPEMAIKLWLLGLWDAKTHTRYFSRDEIGWIKFSLKHEAAHVRDRDACAYSYMQDIAVSALATQVVATGLSKILRRTSGRVPLDIGKGLFALSCGLWAYAAKSFGAQQVDNALRRGVERRADRFAIAHITDPKEFRAAANYLEASHARNIRNFCRAHAYSSETSAMIIELSRAWPWYGRVFYGLAVDPVHPYVLDRADYLRTAADTLKAHQQQR